MKDIQSQFDHRRINIKKVGVKDITYPITVLDKAKKVQRTVARVNMYVNLPHRFKGTHMSRFIEILNRFHGEIDLNSFHCILEEMKTRLEAEAAHIEIEFPYFLEKNRGDANVVGIGEYACRMHGSFADEYDLALEVTVPISPPLPGQSNEALPRSLGHWGYARVCIRFRHFIWIEDLIQMVEEVIGNSCWGSLSVDFDAKPSIPVPQVSGGGGVRTVESSDCHDVLTSRSVAGDGFGGQRFTMSVENITKALGEVLANQPDISWFTVSVENLAEGYSVFSSLEWPS
jgi:GTP cyclohydrolase I